MLEKVEKFFAKVMGGTKTEREIKRLEPLVAKINEIAESYKSLTDDELKAKTQEFKYRLRMGETLDDILPEAYAAVKETCRRLLGKKWLVRGQETEWNMVPYDVQLMGAIVLHEGKIAEMATGEGKTLVATMPLYLNALEGKGAHLVTVNDYLAQRDCEWMGKIYEFLGLKAAALRNDMEPEERRQAYNADITYGTNNEFGFDYLRDNMAVDVWSVVQRDLHYAIIDEVDSVLIDEARTPLIISGAVGAPRNVYYDLKPIVANLYRRQQELVRELVAKGKALLEEDEEEAGLMLLRALRGDPKNQELLELLTSEFWVKKLIERLEGQYEIAKSMAEVDSELYYTIDEKSHVVDITEKGRIFLSGGQDDPDIADKIKQLDDIDDRLGVLSEQKKASRLFTHDSTTGLCNGLTLEGMVALSGGQPNVSEEETKALQMLEERLGQMPDKVAETLQRKKTDKASAWRHYYRFAKKSDRVINGLNDAGRTFLASDGQDENYKKIVDAFAELLDRIRQAADVDGAQTTRQLQDKRRSLQNVFFETDKQYGVPLGLTKAGKAAILSILRGGDPLLMPFIAKIDGMLSGDESMILKAAGKNIGASANQTHEERMRDYFEFSGDGSLIKHVTEKGRIAILGGNPDLYVLPDRSIVELRDQEIQELLDRTLNQAEYDYTSRVVAVEQMERDIEDIGKYIAEEPEKHGPLFFDLQATADENENIIRHLTITEHGKAFISNFAEQTRNIVYKLDEDLRAFKSHPEKLFRIDSSGKVSGLADEEIEKLLGASFSQVEAAIKKWRETTRARGDENPIKLRKSLDEFLQQELNVEQTEGHSLSRAFEEVDRIARVIRVLFDNIYRTDLTPAEKQRLLHRYFSFEGAIPFEENPAPEFRFNGLSDLGVKTFLGEAEFRAIVAEKLFSLMEDRDVDAEAIFEFDESGYPSRLLKTARSLLLDGLPFFSFSEELHNFREEVVRLSAKKVNTRAELESLMVKEKAHIRSKGIMLEDREMTELISKAHAPNTVISPEEIETWCQAYFDRKPRQVLEERRDRLWREYNDVEERIQNIQQLLRAYTLYHKDVDYVVKALEDGDMRGRAASSRGRKAVMIVDQFTGRLMPGRRFSDGLHEALEAKEGVEVQAESQTLATITIQNFFRIYDKLAGMTGTAETESQEFFSTYKLEVVVIPTNKPVIRKDYNDVIFRTKREKYNAIVEEAIEMHNQGRPVLIGTVSVDVSQRLSELFSQRGIPLANWLKKGDVSKELQTGRFHTVLNAKFHHKEAEIVAKAGMPGAITIATNMAGRGTDIKLHPSVVEKGGLHIIGSEKHEARRIDRQLRGRAGRQGDPGSSRFYLSLEDDLMRLFGSDRISNIMSRLGPSEEGERIEHPLITRSIERAQKKVEERNFDIRKNLLQYDDVLNEQRKIIYKRRQNLLGFAKPQDLVESKAKRYFSEEADRSEWRLDALIENLKNFFNKEPDFTAEELEALKHSEIKERVQEWIEEQLEEEKHLIQMQQRHRIFGYCSMENLLEELVRLKIRLHNRGTHDTSLWNRQGIAYELDRIFGEAPDWLNEDTELGTAEQVEKKLFDWVHRLYKEKAQQAREGFNALTFASLTLQEMIDIYINGLMNMHLNAAESPVSWNTDEFLSSLERVFFARPVLGSNEIRTIRREKILQIVRDWVRTLAFENENEMKIRHRILGYFSPQYFVNAIVEYVLGPEGEDGKKLSDLSAEQKSFLGKVFGDSFVEFPEDEDGNIPLTIRLKNLAQESYSDLFHRYLEEYDTMMLARASMEEIIEASIMAVMRQIAQKREIQSSQQLLASNLEYMFLQKPQKALPETTDENTLASFTEDLVAWGLSLYETYAYREERLRQENLSGEIVRDSVYMMIEDTVYAMISKVLGNESELDPSMLKKLESECRLVFRQAPRLRDETDQPMDPNEVMDKLSSWATGLYERRVQEIGENLAKRYERYYILDKIDENWRYHLNAVDELREGIGLRGYGQKDPLLEYKGEAYKMFVQMIDRINRDVVSTLFRIFDVGGEIEEQEMRRVEPKQFRTTHSQVEIFKQVMASKSQAQAGAQQGGQRPRSAQVVKTVRVGRNDPCPCGSGKKYKHCCGRNA